MDVISELWKTMSLPKVEIYGTHLWFIFIDLRIVLFEIQLFLPIFLSLNTRWFGFMCLISKWCMTMANAYLWMINNKGSKHSQFCDHWLQWLHNEHGGVSNHQPCDAIVCLTVYSRRRSKKTSKLRVTGLCGGNSPVTGEFPAHRPSNAENVFIWWVHHDAPICVYPVIVFII